MYPLPIFCGIQETAHIQKNADGSQTKNTQTILMTTF